MKVLGFVLIVLGLVIAYIGITGSQHNVMAIIRGSNNPVASGQSINPSGAANSNQTPANTDSNVTVT